MTFSIVGRDPLTGDLGVAVASKFLAVGALVPFAWAGVGAVATQSYVNPNYGPDGLGLLASGLGPEEVAGQFQAEDPAIRQRQFGIVGADGRSVTFTGEGCHAWAGGEARENMAVQGNILTGPEVVSAMLAAWEAGAGQPLPHRLLTALQAGDAAGGDKRGRQSAALLCVGPGRGYGGLTDDWVNLRADDHPDPCAELERLLGLHDLLFGRPTTTRELTGEELEWLRALLIYEDYATSLPAGPWDAETEAAAWALYGTENLEERWVPGGRFDPVALDYLRERFGESLQDGAADR
ncbi:DUF1028 domain-containing protein [Deinococcus metallilatus]|uniref:DUF1028 domain-containing protein n=1 Tax=Deinococcus metallilatus TaxID=1211322 RepID=A0AAJ5F5E3_9DEIO|nr:DUF1028 domain-containing protein [Deinococcus metallilatus]MBB5296536.1 putative Ntn-hydrolase superfamily protein [Deinococcus metallilatus]QBY08436.1 DUF1028 domain-containing protein [Deinococcus metallilatus]RXJ11235.1 DUF1028 domain-containing protein [Deinococcus metallilatus]TLK24726.1 DUF1028 domain-containing protein [Deinococcus metallilatus]GMA17454.1 hypothetical protein GCM10025871_37850 [Deinococcus metallilatus]